MKELNAFSSTAQNTNSSISNFFRTANLVTFTDEILNVKLNFLCSVMAKIQCLRLESLGLDINRASNSCDKK